MLADSDHCLAHIVTLIQCIPTYLFGCWLVLIFLQGAKDWSDQLQRDAKKQASPKIVFAVQTPTSTTKIH